MTMSSSASRDRRAPFASAPLILGVLLVLGVIAALATFAIVDEDRGTRLFVYAALATGMAAVRLIIPRHNAWDWAGVVLFAATAALLWAYYFELVRFPLVAGVV